MILYQSIALEHIFCELTEGLWDRVFTNALTQTDIIRDLYTEFTIEDLQQILMELAHDFQTVYNMGYEKGYNEGYDMCDKVLCNL